MRRAAIHALSVKLPSERRDNDWFRARAPGVFDDAEHRALGAVFSPDRANPKTRVFDEEMGPFLGDPFRGTVERRALGVGESARTLEGAALDEALRVAGLAPGAIDLLICVSFQPDQLGPGNASFVARDLGMRATVMNLESTCFGTFQALHTAAAFIEAGVHERVAVAVSCTYSRNLDLDDSLAWFLGDAAGAIILGPARDAHEGWRGAHVVNTAETSGAFILDDEARVRPGEENPSWALRETAAPNLLRCTEGALGAAGAQAADIDAWITHTPVAWFHRFAARLWQIDPERLPTRYAEIANVGPALTTTNLHAAAHGGLLRPGDTALLYAFGTVSNAGAAVFGWGDVALGEL